MTRIALAALLCLLFGVTGALAQPPQSSPRPQHRQADVVSRAAPAAPASLAARIVQDVTRSAKPARVVQAAFGGVVPRSPRPLARPENIKRRSIVAAAGFRRVPPATGSRGAICGDPEIQGVRMSPIAGRIRGCGVEAPVRVTSVAGVALSHEATMDCATAKALKTWVERGAKPAVGKLGGGIAALQVAAHYSCRSRNGKSGARISEHGKGRAIDISAIRLRNGAELSVLKHWRSRDHSRVMKAMHRAACGPFGTVLGPDSDRHHQDHFHFDTARYRSGAYCK